MNKALLLCMAAQSLWTAQVCKPCHPNQTAAYLRSPMGNAIGVPATDTPVTFTHLKSKTQFAILNREGQLRQQITRGGTSADYAVSYRIGSGTHASGYLVLLNRWLFQSPVARYKRLNLWDVAPGYETMTHPDFNRRVSPECLACHSSGPIEALQPISCEQCHGPSSQHLENPTRTNISNPARTSIEARDAVCEQCHLNGEARIQNPPGNPQSHSIVIFDRPRNDLRVVSHVEQLELSVCARQSQGKLWCGTCHHPHGPAIQIDAQCRSCHSTALPASHQDRKECVACHMPKRDAVDGGHTAFTDHRIQRQPGLASTNGPTRLRLWREAHDPALRERNLGLASILVGERDGSTDLINDGYRRLAAVYPRWPNDPDVLAALGMVLFLKDQKQDALKLLEAAVAQRPQDPVLQEKLGLLRRSAANISGAIESLEKSIALDPGRESAYFFLADCQPTLQAREKVLKRLLTIFPQSLIGREALRNSARP